MTRAFAVRLPQLAGVLAVAVAMGLAGILASRQSYDLLRELELSRVTGWGAVAAFLSSFAASPIARVSARVSRVRLDPAKVGAWRRGLGLTAAAIATVHAALSFASYAHWDWDVVAGVPFLRGGACALVLLGILALTSFRPVIRSARIRQWKLLHRLVYLVPIFVLQHLLLSPFAPRLWVLLLAALFVVLVAGRLVPARRRV